MRLNVRAKIILPFVLLLLLVGMLGTAVVSARVTSAADAEFNGALLRASLLANDHLSALEAERLAQLRAAAGTVGVAEAIRAGDAGALARLLVPLQANARPANLTLRALDAQGRELLAIPVGAAPIARSLSRAYAAYPAVQDVLAARTDGRGDKFLFLAREDVGIVLYWVGPARTDQDQLVGAILVGESLADIADRIRASRASDLIFYDAMGKVLSASLPTASALTDSTRATIATDRPVHFAESVNGRAYALLVSDWTMRGSRLGYLAVALNADGLQAALVQVRLMLVALFGGTALLTMLVGSAVAGRITRPLGQLVGTIRQVSAGDLSARAPAGPPDEIGYLSRSFNEMTASLEAKTHELEETYFASMETLARAIDARDPYTLGHSSRVAAISLELADAMKIPAVERESLRRAALLHDIGKIGVEDMLLRKPGRLTERETEVMRRHPVIGYDMLAGLRFLRDSLPGVRHHHERWDGTGYPDRLKGKNIPQLVRILSVADVFDALTTDRPYARGLSYAAATRFISAQTGAQFDPAVIAAFESRVDAITGLLSKMGKAPAPHPADITWLADVS